MKGTSMVQVAIIIVAALPAVFLLALWSSFHTVREGDVEVLLVFGEVRQVLEPGRYFIPPFVSATYRVDFQTMQYETPRGRRLVPSAFREEVERIAMNRANAEEART